MKAYLINTAERTITEVEHNGDYRNIYKLCGFDCFTTVNFDKGDAVYVDDNGMIKGPVYQFFGFLGYPQPLAGNGLILGCNDEGESTDPAYPLDFYKQRLCWIERLMEKRWGVKKAMSRATQVMSSHDVQKFLEHPL